MDDEDEVLLRCVHPDLIHEGAPSSRAFLPSDADAGCLSVDRGVLVTPAAAMKLQAAPKPDGFGGLRVGVWGVSVGEARALAVPPRPDPVLEEPGTRTPANPAHAVIDFNGIKGSNAQRRVAKALAGHAKARGRLHPSP